jgi:hypothetical protein
MAARGREYQVRNRVLFFIPVDLNMLQYFVLRYVPKPDILKNRPTIFLDVTPWG